jgi:hypothetical protein
MSDQELRDAFDYAVGPGHQNPSRAEFYRDELRRRQAAHTEHLMSSMTVAIAGMTLVILVLTVANVIVVAAD